jgi:hypothetical protein
VPWRRLFPRFFRERRAKNSRPATAPALVAMTGQFPKERHFDFSSTSPAALSDLKI